MVAASDAGAHMGDLSGAHMGDLSGWGLRHWVTAAASPGAEIGRVVKVDRGECDVATAAGPVRVLSDSTRSQSEIAPVTGDWVELDVPAGAGAEAQPVITRVLPRATALSRRDPAERPSAQVLAANFDVVGIVAGLDRPLSPGRFERLLVMGLDSGASVLVILSKADLSRRVDDALLTVRSVVADTAVVTTSVVTGEGIIEVLGHLGAGRTLVLVGASGSGKSSMLNALAGAEVVATGAVRAGDARGRHVTVARELVRLDGDAGLVLDTPGLRSLGLWEAEDALRRVFGDIEELAAECRFNDCAHDAEPDCAVRAAIQDGVISRRRVQRATELRRELQRQHKRAGRRRR